jgi:hypothetical protein
MFRHQTQSCNRWASAGRSLIRPRQNLGLLALQRPGTISHRDLIGQAVSAAVDVQTTALSAQGMCASRAVISTSQSER